MDSRLLLIGGGGHCKSVIDTLQQNNQYSDIAVVDKKTNIGNRINGVPVIGCDDDLVNLFKQGYHSAFVTVGSVREPSIRVELLSMLEDLRFNIPNIIDSSAVISKSITIEKGVYIGKGTVVNMGVSIGKGAIINTSSTIEHDCIIGEFSHISPGAVLCGEVRIGSNTHIGAGSVVKQQINIGNNTIIGMGSVVLNDVDDGVIAYGNPCKGVRKNECLYHS